MTQQVTDEQTNKETNNGAPKHEINGQDMSELTIKDWMAHERKNERSLISQSH